MVILLCLLMPLFGSDFLFFPGEKNQVVIGSQKILFAKPSPTVTTIGPFQVDTSMLKLLYGAKSGFVFTWPSELINRGEFTVIDNSGRRLASFPLGSVKAGEATTTIKVSRVPVSLLERLAFTSFFNACAESSEGKNRFRVCSQDVTMEKRADGYVLGAYRPEVKEAFVEVNGRQAGDNGEITLSEAGKTLLLRSYSPDGSHFHLETSYSPPTVVDFVQIGDEVQLRLKDSRPPDNQAVAADGSWLAKIDKSESTFWILGTVGFPLNQVIKLPDRIPQESDRVSYQGERGVFGSTAVFKLEVPEGYRAKAGPGSYLASGVWNFKNLKLGEDNRRLLLLKSPNGDFYADLTAERSPAYQFHLGTLRFPDVYTGLAIALGKRSWLVLDYDRKVSKVAESEVTLAGDFNLGTSGKFRLGVRRELVGDLAGNLALVGYKYLRDRIYYQGEWAGASFGGDLKTQTDFRFTLGRHYKISNTWKGDVGIGLRYLKRPSRSGWDTLLPLQLAVLF